MPLVCSREIFLEGERKDRQRASTVAIRRPSGASAHSTIWGSIPRRVFHRSSELCGGGDEGRPFTTSLRARC